jgi:hypothetical protein
MRFARLSTKTLYLTHLQGAVSNWTFDYFFYNAAKHPCRGCFAAYLTLAPIFSEKIGAI